MKTTVQQRDTFQVLDETERMEYINVFVELLEVSVAGGRSVVEGAKSLVTAGGEEVDRIARGKFRVRRTGRRLYCDVDSPYA